MEGKDEQSKKTTVHAKNRKFLKQAADYGNFVAVCYSQEIALKVIEDYVTLKTGEIMPIENNQVLKRWEEKKWQK